MLASGGCKGFKIDRGEHQLSYGEAEIIDWILWSFEAGNEVGGSGLYTFKPSFEIGEFCRSPIACDVGKSRSVSVVLIGVGEEVVVQMECQRALLPEGSCNQAADKQEL